MSRSGDNRWASTEVLAALTLGTPAAVTAGFRPGRSPFPGRRRSRPGGPASPATGHGGGRGGSLIVRTLPAPVEPST
jgi:hypothetical protein